MKPVYAHLSGALALTFAIAACVPAAAPPPVAAPSPTPTPTPSPSPTPTPVAQAQVYDSYLDAPQTPGDWEYVDSGSTGSQATFRQVGGIERFALNCAAASRQVRLIRYGSPANGARIAIIAETLQRSLALAPLVGARGGNMSFAGVSANDPLLDAMAITKGRFAVETEGMPTLYIPAWPEVSRVIEDCR